MALRKAVYLLICGKWFFSNKKQEHNFTLFELARKDIFSN